MLACDALCRAVPRDLLSDAELPATAERLGEEVLESSSTMSQMATSLTLGDRRAESGARLHRLPY